MTTHLTDTQRAVLSHLQGDLPAGPEPYDELAERAGMTVEAFLATARGLVEAGYLRRVSALLHHVEAGFRGNAMVAWEVPADRVAEAGRAMAGFDAVSHCYERPALPGWPYTLYTMLHARTREDAAAVVRRIADAVRPASYRVLYSLRELKKRSLPVLD